MEAGTTLVSNNPVCTQGTVPDDVLGSGTIFLNGGTLSTTQDGKAGIKYAYERGVYNPIVVRGNSSLASVGNTEMFVWGNISGSGLITEGVGYSLRLKGATRPTPATGTSRRTTLASRPMKAFTFRRQTETSDPEPSISTAAGCGHSTRQRRLFWMPRSSWFPAKRQASATAHSPSPAT